MINEIDQINYTPNLNFSKIHCHTNRHSTDSYNSKNDIKHNVDTSNNSSALADFYNNATSNLLNTISSIESDIASITNVNADNTVDSMLSGVSIDEKNDFISSNYNDIDGSTKLEFSLELNKINQEVKLIKELLCLYTYGDKNISLSDASQEDFKEYSYLSSLESKGKYENVNYLSLHIESYTNSIISIYLNLLSDLVISQATDFNEKKDLYVNNNNYRQLFEKKFNKITKNLQDSICKDKSSLYNIQVIIDNVYIRLQEYEDFLYDECKVRFQYLDCDMYDVLNDEYVNNLSQALEQLYKVLHQIINNKIEIIDYISQRGNIRKYLKNGGGVATV